jgi:hypothetical protein
MSTQQERAKQDHVALEECISAMMVAAGVGVCSVSACSKHAYLEDILKLGYKQGFNIWGDREEINK